MIIIYFRFITKRKNVIPVANNEYRYIMIHSEAPLVASK